MPHFLYRLNPPRASFASDLTEGEAALMQQHSAYWSDLAGRDIAIVFGPVLDPGGVWGLAVFEAETPEGAEALARRDPVISAGCGFSFKLHPMLSAVTKSTA